MRLRLETVMTGRGSTVVPASAGLLSTLLEQFDEELRSQGVDVSEHLAPGVSADYVARVLGDIGLEPPDELVAWFGWHNGPLPATRSYLPQFITPISVEDAVAVHKAKMSGDEELRWDVHPGWVKLESPSFGLSVNCEESPENPPLVRRSDVDLPLSREGSFRQVVSLCTVVAWWIDALDRGAYSYDRVDKTWRWDLSLLPDAYRAAM
jgi:hypothetical protein